MPLKDIKNFTLQKLKNEMEAISEPKYRAKQIAFWLYKKYADSFDSMKNIPQQLKDKLKSLYFIKIPVLSGRLRSDDGTEKFLFKLADKNFIETVLIPSAGRNTVCISTQVGCRFGCIFCASGAMGFIRNLTASEMLDQILFLQHKLNCEITNIVFMGMGEPLDNYENVADAVRIINDPEALGIAARRITISTCGIIPGIEKLKSLGMQINLSISLHAARENLRSSLMPVNKIYPLEKLIRACQDYISSGGRMITLEYILINGKNDSIEDAKRLAEIAKRLKAKINLIPCSKVDSFIPGPSDKARALIFIEQLKKSGASPTLRRSKGEEIKAACGQLAGACDRR